MGHITAKGEYLALQKRLDKNPVGAPARPELFEILKELFTEEECAIAAAMPMKLASAQHIAKNARKDIKRTEDVLDTLVKKGLIADIPSPKGTVFYALNPTVIGFFEFSMMRIRKQIDQKKVAGLLWEYFHEDSDKAFMKMLAEGSTFLARPMVHEDVLDADVYSEVLDWEKATQAIENAGAWAVGLCYCRHVKQHLDQPCEMETPLESCLSLGFGAKYLANAGMSKFIEKSQAMDILTASRERGLVQMADNVKKRPHFICNCCKCCCEMMVGFRTIPPAANVVSSNYEAVPDEQGCNGCGKCAKVCPVDVIEMVPATPTEKAKKRKKRAVVNMDLCLGCGVCQRQCKFEAMSIQPAEIRVYTPERMMEKVLVQALERNKLQYMMFDDPSRVSHRVLASLVGVLLRLPPAKQILAQQQIRSRFVNKIIDTASRTRDGWMMKI